MPDAPSTDWPLEVHRALVAAGVSQVGYVPDAGLKRLIEVCGKDPTMRTISLTTEGEGVGLAAGAWLGGAKAVLLMQSSGVGNLANALAMARTCRFPLMMIVTMRGEEGETNPWQTPMGGAATKLLEAMEVEVVRADAAERVAPAVEGALRRAFDDEAGAAVLVAQRVIGVKRFEAASR